MRFRWLNDYWQGTILGLCLIVVSLWMGLTGKLSLYIHPRYIAFTLIMSSLALVVLLAAFWKKTGHAKITARTTLPGLLLGIVCAGLVISLLISKPVPLTSATATQRGINSGALDPDAQLDTLTMQLPHSNDYSQLTVREWASLLGQTADVSFFRDKRADVTGFISPASGNSDVFFVSRFIVSCCAVDARPVGVPVYAPDWRKTYTPDQWVRVKGVFAPIKGAMSEVAITPETVTTIDQPEDPYAF